MQKELASEFETKIDHILAGLSKNVVLFSSIFPFTKMINQNPKSFCNDLLRLLMKKTNTLFLPTFTSGFKDGVCNLDEEKSSTGVLTELFRLKEGVKRTFCPCFSFGVYGDKAYEAIALRPKEAWGKGSLYEWFYDNDVAIMTVGTYPTHCSFTHYLEWLAKDIITYRYDKNFEGDIVLNGKKEHCKTTLFVRHLEPSPLIDWTWSLDTLVEAGMMVEDINGVKISAISARKKIDTLLPYVQKDKFCLISNRQDFE